LQGRVVSSSLWHRNSRYGPCVRYFSWQRRRRAKPREAHRRTKKQQSSRESGHFLENVVQTEIVKWHRVIHGSAEEHIFSLLSVWESWPNPLVSLREAAGLLPCHLAEVDAVSTKTWTA
jgi:hypothetical protein